MLLDRRIALDGQSSAMLRCSASPSFFFVL